MADLYAVKVMYTAATKEVSDRIEWCKENNIDFFIKSLFGCYIAGKYYTEEEMKEVGTLFLGGVEIDLHKKSPTNTGTVFIFYSEEDVTGFKLTWI